MPYLFYFRVCKQWHRISNDKKLWRHVDITPDRVNQMNLKIMWKFLRSLSEVLLTLKLRSGDSSGKRFIYDNAL